MRNSNILKSCVSEICVKQIRVNQGVDVVSIEGIFSINAKNDLKKKKSTFLKSDLKTQKSFDSKVVFGILKSKKMLN